ncbi:hypothetical protein BSKO_06995 [Bryopsis sp. KO-2023]|nr:hypothetical protein BSKO_06995 [Bryopsis sp. KO-2023]
MSSIVCPGDRLGLESELKAATGTYKRDGFVYASIVGRRQEISGEEGKNPIISVVNERATKRVVPKVGDIIMGRVNRLQAQYVGVEILCIGKQALRTLFNGTIRSQDVRATQIDTVKLPDCFMPGDLVRAEVISLGDVRSYYLTTARNDLGVVYAESMAGIPMVPIGWNEMQCPKTKVKEQRKVAKVEN